MSLLAPHIEESSVNFIYLRVICIEKGKEMTPEEYFYLEELIEKEEWDLKLLKNIEYLPWVLEMHRQGRIRTETIVEVIPLNALYRCLSTLEEMEEYEYCDSVWNLILEAYPIELYLN